MPYADPRIQECSLAEFLANHNIWHVKVPLVIFAMIEIHESNLVMQQFGCTQRILSPPEELDDLYKIDLRGRLKEYWLHSTRSISRCGSIASLFYRGESSSQPLTQPEGIHDRWLGHDQVQPKRKETKSAINPDMHTKLKKKSRSSRQTQ
ncbi:hypothetical protein PVK06_023702 [Gossypium arboreum]|uniref:Uncharacterized protein n=1 Tax=Gossypium arboreum TaxID=29729 RepID=A0ABR0PC78_GOSAR|nr:hypothetical protein PVK06_023702 [Gossypium arboreum]